MCFKGLQRCFSGVLLFATLSHQRAQRQKEDAILLKMRDSLRLSGTTTQRRAQSRVVNVGYYMFWIRHSLHTVIPRLDTHVIDIIIDFVRPPIPQLAFLGCSGLHGITSKANQEVAYSSLLRASVVASDDGVIACAREDIAEAMSWSVHSQEDHFRPRLFRGARAPLVSLSVNAMLDVIVGGCEDGVICVWNIATGELLATCEYYEWYDRCGRYGLGHWFPVRAVSSGSIFTHVGRDVVSGDEKGTLCAWELGYNGGLAKLCVNVAEQLRSSCSSITCTASMYGLVLCGLHQGLAIGYSALSGQCLFLLAAPMTSSLMTFGCLQSSAGTSKEVASKGFIGCFADGTVLQWSVLEHKGAAHPVLPLFQVCGASTEASVKSDSARAHLLTKEGKVNLAWAANSENPNELLLRWTAHDSGGRLCTWSTHTSWPGERGQLQGVVHL